jgi:hypothetical protein
MADRISRRKTAEADNQLRISHEPWTRCSAAQLESTPDGTCAAINPAWQTRTSRTRVSSAWRMPRSGLRADDESARRNRLRRLCHAGISLLDVGRRASQGA